MEITRKEMNLFRLDGKEYDALRKCREIMNELLKQYPYSLNQTLISEITGECVDAHDFARMNAVIDFLIETPPYYVQD